jgi:hypothetical protein
MEFPKILEVRALLKLGYGSRDLIDAALRHASWPFEIFEIFPLDPFILGVVFTHGFPAPWPSDHSERAWRYLLGVCWPAAPSHRERPPTPPGLQAARPYA